MSPMMWILSIVGTLGVVGTIAAAILFPAVVIPVLQAVTAAVLRCKPCLIALAILASLFVGALYGAHVEKAKCRAGELAAKLRNAQIDAANAEKSRLDEANRAQTIEETAHDRQQDDADYIHHLEGRPACLLDDGDVLPGRVPNHRSGPGRAKPAAPAR